MIVLNIDQIMESLDSEKMHEGYYLLRDENANVAIVTVAYILYNLLVKFCDSTEGSIETMDSLSLLIKDLLKNNFEKDRSPFSVNN